MADRSPPTEVIVRGPDGEQLVTRSAHLEVTRGPARGERVPVESHAVVVGAAPECDLTLDDPAVSQQQFEVRPTRNGFILRDLESTNGTFVEQVRVMEAVLHPGARIAVGRTRIRLVQLNDEQVFPLSRHHRCGRLLGESASMRRCFALLEGAAESQATVLLEGESGTGKELAAEAVHEASARADAPLVVVDCGALPPSLIESELFGHERGAFTGATAARVGAFERADRGTLFLDEIGELDLALQPKLLRFLETREVQRIGGAERHKVDVRVIAATNRRLENLVADTLFRQDLFYRLAVIRVRLPALRERLEDLPILALALARQIRPDVDAATWLDAATLDVLGKHRWPGNVRELRNVIERLSALPLAPSELLLEGAPASAPAAGATTAPAAGATTATAEGTTDDAPRTTAIADLGYHEAKQRVVDSFERDYVRTLLSLEEGIVARAAQRAQVPRQTFFRLIRKHGIRGAADG